MSYRLLSRNLLSFDLPLHNYAFPAIFVRGIIATILLFDYFLSGLSNMRPFINFDVFWRLEHLLRIILHINYGQ